MSGKMQEKETEISSLFEKKVCHFVNDIICYGGFFSFSVHQGPIFFLSFTSCNDPCTYCKHITGIEQARFFFQCYSSNTDLMNNSSDFTACCGVMKFTPISDLRRAFLTAFSGWVCLSQLLEKFSEWETEKANSISICIIW